MQKSQLAVSNSYLIHYFGDARETAPLPGTTWPQVYDRIQMSLPVWWNISYGVWGPKFYTFKALPFAGKNGFAAGISRIYMFIYNAAARKYTYVLPFPNPASAGDIRSVDDARWLGAVAYDDGVVTLYEWRDPAAAPVVKCKVSIDDEIRGVAISARGRVFAAGNKGIYEIINGGRAGLIDEEALCRELAGERLFAYLDVFYEEPLPGSSPLYTMPNLVMTPHNAGFPGRKEFLPFLLDEFDRALKGEKALCEISARRFTTMTVEQLGKKK